MPGVERGSRCAARRVEPALRCGRLPGLGVVRDQFLASLGRRPTRPTAPCDGRALGSFCPSCCATEDGASSTRLGGVSVGRLPPVAWSRIRGAAIVIAGPL
jgi:hypothetical protein